jgi:uncharacterized protein (DUF1697 family)
MQTYISLLRGINVSGQKQIKMTDLKGLYEQLGFSNVETYIQSGNVIFKTNETLTKTELESNIEKVIAQKYGFDVPVLILKLNDLKLAFNGVPFTQENQFEDFTYITFLKNIPNTTNIEPILLKDYSPERLVITNNIIYLYCPTGYGRTKLNNNFFESKLKVMATTRNYNTCLKLIELAEK